MAESKKQAVYTPRLKALYRDTYVKELQAELKLDNVHEVPVLEKIVVSVGTGKTKDDKRMLETVKNTLTRITGQAPVERLAKKSIATFKIRAGMGAPVGINVTLRGTQMYEFLDRFVMSHCRAFATFTASASSLIAAVTTISALLTRASSPNSVSRKHNSSTACKSRLPSSKATN